MAVNIDGLQSKQGDPWIKSLHSLFTSRSMFNVTESPSRRLCIDRAGLCQIARSALREYCRFVQSHTRYRVFSSSSAIDSTNSRAKGFGARGAITDRQLELINFVDHRGMKNLDDNHLLANLQHFNETREFLPSNSNDEIQPTSMKKPRLSEVDQLERFQVAFKDTKREHQVPVPSATSASGFRRKRNKQTASSSSSVSSSTSREQCEQELEEL